MPQSANGSATEIHNCLHCHRSNVTLHELPEVTYLFLKNNSLVDTSIKKACKFCIEDFERFRNSPTVFAEKIKAEMAQKKKVWGERTEILKNAYRLFQTNNYETAEPLYREYLKTIETVLDVPLNNISPQLFVNRGHQDELSTFTLTLWDMIIISDQLEKPDTSIFATKFVEMAKGSIARSTLIHSIKKYKRRAKDKKLFKQILIDLRGDSGCFIASHIYANAYSPEVMLLREFRDQKLMPSQVGRLVVRLYYKISPELMRFIPKKIAQSKILRKIISALLLQ